MAVRIWLWLSVLGGVAGWGLSALGQLNRVGYSLFFGLVAAVLWFGRKRMGWELPRRPCRWRRLRRRWRRPWPLGFAALALLVFVGGVLYPPANHTALTYRIPRVLDWLAEGRWHWIHTINYRMNDRACGIEWLSAPLLLFTRSDRGLFLLNFIPFLLLPGLTFSVFRRLGVRPRAAWYWMWLLPGGYTFLLQAGSAGNDAFPTVYALAALDFGCRAWATRRPWDLWLSLLSAALLTGTKASNLPLLLPWTVLVLPLLPVLKPRPLATLGVALLAAAVSFLPTALLNVHYCGDWSGLRLERAGMDLKNPWVGLWGNALVLLLHNFVLPIFPAAGWWNQSGLSLLPPAMARALTANFENGFHQLKELPTEDWAGLGFGLSLLLGISALASLCRGGHRRAGPEGRVPSVAAVAPERRFDPWTLDPRPPGERSLAVPARIRWWVLACAWVALLAYCAKSGMATGARIISPYYPLLAASLLVGGRQSEIVRRRWWQWLAWAVFGLALLVLVLTPGRPLWPARTVLSKGLALRPGQPLLARALNVYAVYADRWDPLANVRALLPPGRAATGFLADGDDIDISLRRPFFQRPVEHILLEDSPADLGRRHIQYVVVGGAFLASRHTTLAAWQARTGAELIATTTATLKVAEGPQSWHVLRLPP